MPRLPDDPFLVFLRPLNASGFQYMVAGSVASTLYGEPRSTHDIDLILVLPKSRAGEFECLFPRESFYCPPEEIIRIEMARPADGHFNLIHHQSGFKADVYLAGKDPLHQWALENTRRIELGGGDSVPLAPPEYVIVRKLAYFRMGGGEKHLRDIRAMLELSSEEIDRNLLDQKIEEEGLAATWQLIQED